MASLGNKFQTVRETLGLTLGQMVLKTKIQASHLKALEADSFEQLPERVFAKGFVRAYARSLELDEEECLRLFEECSASFYQNQKEKESEGIRKMFLHKEDVQKERTSRAMIVFLIGGLLLLGGLVLLQQQSPSTSIFSRFSQQPVEPEPRDEGVSQPGRANEVVEGPESPSIAPQGGGSRVSNADSVLETEVAETSAESAVEDGTSTPSLSSPDSAPAPASMTDSENGPLVLEIQTFDMTWAVIRSDEDKPQEILLQAGDIVRREARDRFLLTLGNAGGVEVRLNGELQGPFGETGDVVRDMELKP